VPVVFFYISGHGFGHAVRQIEIINTLQDLAPELNVVVRTSAPEWLFSRTVRRACTRLPGETDTGVVQIDSLRPDPHQTIVRAAAFHDTLPRRIDEEVATLRRYGADFVVSDAPPLACAAGRAAGIKSVLCANFTWDWIYADYIADYPPASPLLSSVQEAYACASAAWRMPMHGGFETIAPIIDIPFVSRHARSPRADTRRILRLPAGQPLALVSFGGFGLRDLPLETLDCLPHWGIVLTTTTDPPRLPVGVHAVSEAEMYEAGLRYEDLVRAVDLVVTKPGYGIVSDCVANDTALVYTSRGRFPEYEVMVREMPRVLRCRPLEMESFAEGRWKAALDEAVQMAGPSERVRTDGAHVVARSILGHLAAS